MSSRCPVSLCRALLFVCFLAFPIRGVAQVQAGRIVGIVVDPSGAAVPEASITVTEVQTNLSHTVTSSGNGEYAVTPLAPGIYQVKITRNGFRSVIRSGIELLVGQVAQVDIALALGDTSTVVEVDAQAPLVDTQSGTVGQVITTKEILDLPLNGRSFFELGRLTPGAAQTPGITSFPVRPNIESGMNISGVRGRQTMFLMDGADVTDQHQGGTLIRTSIDALQEFKVQQNGYSAESSRAGGSFNATTKSGTNQVHGAAFEFLRNDKMDARDFFANKREILKRNQFGGVVGGPLSMPKLYDARNRTFFFLSYDGERQSRGMVFSDILPSTAMLQGDFSAPGLNRIYDPLTTKGSGATATRTQFPANIIPLSRLADPSVFLSKYIPAPNSGPSTGVFAPAQHISYDQTMVRVDHQITSRNLLFGRWSYIDVREDDPNAFPKFGVAPLRSRAQNVVAALTSTISPTLIHEFRFNMLFMTIDLGTFLSGTNWNQLAGIRGFEQTANDPTRAGTFPDFNLSGYTAINTSGSYPPKTQNHLVYEYMDNLTWVRGKHILKAGLKIRRNRPLFTDTKFYQGLSSYTGVETMNPAAPAGSGNAIADFMLGYPFSVNRTTEGIVFGGLAIAQHYFVQDDIRVSGTLTLNLGFRYEYSPWLKGWGNQLGTFDGKSAKPLIIASETNQVDLSVQPAAQFAYPLYKDLIQTSSQAGLPIQITQNDMRQFGPRIGFAWQPLGPRTVIRGGYGIFYEPENSDGRVNLNMIPFKIDETVFNDQAAVPTRTIADPFLGLPPGSNQSATSISPTYTNLRMGSDEHWSLGFQRELFKNVALEIDYVGNKGSHLNNTNDANNPPAGPGTVQNRRPYPLFGTIQYFSQDMSSSYNSLQAKIEKRYSSGFSFLASYTFSKAMLNQNAPVTGGNNAFETSLADYNIPQNFAFNASYELPFGKGRHFLSSSRGLLNALADGWQTQGIIGRRSGLPFTPTISTDPANVGLSSERPNRRGSGELANPTPDLWFDKTAFTVPAAFTYGNSGRYILQAGPLRFLDMSLFKEFYPTEKSRLQFRFEAFNLTNTASFNPPGTAIDTASGGKVTSSSNNPRQLQVALKYLF